jgi:hypothetical protein
MDASLTGAAEGVASEERGWGAASKLEERGGLVLE